MKIRMPCGQVPAFLAKFLPTPTCCRAYLSFSEIENVMHSGFSTYTQYEIAFPLSQARVTDFR
jgi:hypothetical protein